MRRLEKSKSDDDFGRISIFIGTTKNKKCNALQKLSTTNAMFVREINKC